MRLVLAVLATVALAAAHHGGSHGVPTLFEDSHEYEYSYRSLVATGLPRQSTKYAGLEKDGVLKVQVKPGLNHHRKNVAFFLTQLTTGSFTTEVEDVEQLRVGSLPRVAENSVEKYGPVWVTYRDNLVTEFVVPTGMPEEVANLYRAVAAAFTVGKAEPHGDADHSHYPTDHPQHHRHQHDLHQGHDDHPEGHHDHHHLPEAPVVYRRQEQGLTGEVEVMYEVTSSGDQYHFMNLTKTVNYMNQVGREGRFFQNGHDERGCQNVCPTHKPEKVDPNMQPEKFAWEMPVAEGCPVAYHPNRDLVETFTSHSYNVSVQHDGEFGVVEGVYAVDKKILPLRRQQVKSVSVVQLNLVRDSVLTRPWTRDGSQVRKYADLTYRFPEGHKAELPYLGLYNEAQDADLLRNQIVPLVKALAEVVVADHLALDGQTGDKIVQLTMGLGQLRKDGLQALWNLFAGTATTSDLDQVQRKVFVDTLALSGSNDAAEFLLDLVLQKKLNFLETVHTLKAMQKNLVRPTISVFHKLQTLCTDSKFLKERLVFSTACVAFAEAVRVHCGDELHVGKSWNTTGTHGEFCGETEYKQYVGSVVQALKSATTFAQQTVYVHVLGRLAHPDAVHALVPWIFGEHEVLGQVEQVASKNPKESTSEYLKFVRQVALYSLHHAAKQHGAAVQPLVQSVYFNQQEDYQLRIAALSVLLATQPTEATFGRIVTELGREQDLEVASYAYSALHSLVKATLPCMAQSARRLQNVLGALPTKTFGSNRSKWAAYTRFVPASQLGLKGHWEVTQSNVSVVPRSFYAGFTANKGPFVSTAFDFGFVTKGADSFGRFNNNDLGKVVENVMKRLRRSAREHTGSETVQGLLEGLDQVMKFNADGQEEEFRAVVFGNYLGNELFVPVDKDYFGHAVSQGAEYLSAFLGKDSSEKTFRYLHIFMPRTYVQVAPGVNGLPVLLSNRNPVVLSVSLKDFQARFGKATEPSNASVAALSAYLRATAYQTSVHSVLTINPLGQTKYAYGVRAVERTYVSVPADVGVQYTAQTKTAAFSVRPRFGKVFFHKAGAVTFETEALLVAGANKPLIKFTNLIKTQSRPFLYDQTFGQNSGMPLRLQGMSMHEEYAVNVLTSGSEHGIVGSLIEEVANDWFVPRTWAVRLASGGAKQFKVVLRLNARSTGVNGQQSKETLNKKSQAPMKTMTNDGLMNPDMKQMQGEEQNYPEHLRMISFAQEYEKVTGRKVDTARVSQAVDRIAKKTQKYWTQVDEDIRPRLTGKSMEGRTWALEYLITAEGWNRDLSAVSGHLVIASTPDNRAKLAELQMKSEAVPWSFEAQMVSAFTKLPQPFETAVREQGQRGIVGFVAELDTPSTGKQEFSGRIEMTKSDEQKRLMKAPATQKPWYYRQCEKDKVAGTAEMSTACELSRFQKSALNQVRLEVDLPQKVHPVLIDTMHQIRQALKARYYGNMRAAYGSQDTQSNKLKAMLTYAEPYPMAGMIYLTIQTADHEELLFDLFPGLKGLRPNGMWSMKEQIVAFSKHERPGPVCIYNGHHIRTFDNVTFPVTSMTTGQKYVVARDNSEQSTFVVLAQQQNHGHENWTDIEVGLYGSTLLWLTPSQHKGAYKVRVNGTELDVTMEERRLPLWTGHSKDSLHLYVQQHSEGRDTLVAQVANLNLGFVYDGKNLKVVVTNPLLKGRLTGLCGDMNNQPLREMTGPHGCDFTNEKDFVRSFAVKSGSWTPEGSWTCPEGQWPRGVDHGPESSTQKASTSLKSAQEAEQRFSLRQSHGLLVPETKTMILGGKICFSTDPVNTCASDSRQLQSEIQSVAFTCFKARSTQATQLHRQLRSGQHLPILTNLPGGQAVEYEIEVATRCAH